MLRGTSVLFVCVQALRVAMTGHDFCIGTVQTLTKITIMYCDVLREPQEVTNEITETRTAAGRRGTCRGGPSVERR